MILELQQLALNAVQGQPDPWGFDEAPVETWADILRPQSLDLALLAAFLVLAMSLSGIGLRPPGMPLTVSSTELASIALRSIT